MKLRNLIPHSCLVLATACGSKAKENALNDSLQHDDSSSAAVSMYTFHIDKESNVDVILTQSGCYKPKMLTSCKDCAQMIEIETSESCTSESDRLRFNLVDLKLSSPTTDIVIVNPVQNRNLTDAQVCENERLTLKRLFNMGDDKYEFMKTGNYVPYYRQASNRLGLSDLYPCEGTAVERLRKTFYDF